MCGGSALKILSKCLFLGPPSKLLARGQRLKGRNNKLISFHSFLGKYKPGEFEILLQNFHDCVSSHRIPKDCAGGAQSAWAINVEIIKKMKEERTQSTFFIIFDEHFAGGFSSLLKAVRDKRIF
jgi:hypothetical protein